MDYSHAQVKEIILKFLTAQAQAEQEILFLKERINQLEDAALKTEHKE
jgi:hypothetical protein